MNPFPMLARVAILLALLSSGTAYGEESSPAEVMLIGTFHFTNPGRDSVKSEVTDVMSDENQAYLDELTGRIAAFKPTAVLLEYDREKDELINGRYQQYLEGDYELGVNEIYQLGFRIAKKAGLDRVESFDEREVHWDAEPLLEKMGKDLPVRKAEWDALIESIGKEMTEMHGSLTLAELLRHFNQAEGEQKNKALYIMTNDIGAGDGFEGATASASWWHRNFRMYANIQRHAQPGTRVVAIGGQGHTAILKDLLADDPDRTAAPVGQLF